jgi:hypothetical protein
MFRLFFMNTTTRTDSKPFSVTLWGSHPEEDNDDCWMGDDFATLAEAESAYRDPASISLGAASEMAGGSVAYIMLDGPGLDEPMVRKNPSHKPRRRDDDSEWRREFAQQAGMAFGCDGYNDAMGC